jgi:hypothetical protein
LPQALIRITIGRVYVLEAVMGNLRKLTLSIDEGVIRRARRYSRRHNVSISRLVTNYLAGLDEPARTLPTSRTVNRLRGILPANVSVEEHREHLEKKYR